MKEKDPNMSILDEMLAEALNRKIEEEMANMEGMRPLVETLVEFGIRGTNVVGFISKFINRTMEKNKEETSNEN